MTIDTVALFKAKQELNTFLNAHPKYKESQQKIEKLLLESGNENNRQALIASLVSEQLQRLEAAMTEFTTRVTRYAEATVKLIELQERE